MVEARGDERLASVVIRDDERGEEVEAGANALFVMIGERPMTTGIVYDKYAGSYSGDLTRWRRSALPVAVDLANDTSEGGSR